MAAPIFVGDSLGDSAVMTQTTIRTERTARRSPDGVDVRKRQGNDYMRHEVEHPDPAEAIPFFCECGDPDCFAPVWLTGPAYDQLRASSEGHVLIATHREQIAA
jgi:hypothetical protein